MSASQTQKKDFRPGLISQCAGYQDFSAIRDLLETPWAGGFAACAAKEWGWDHFQREPGFRACLEAPLAPFQSRDGADVGPLCELNLWRNPIKGDCEEIILTREDDRFFLQHFVLHTQSLPQDIFLHSVMEPVVLPDMTSASVGQVCLPCWWKPVHGLKPRRNCLLFDALSAVEVVIPSLRLNIFLTSEEMPS